MTRRDWIEWVQLELSAMAAAAAESKDFEIAGELMASCVSLDTALGSMSQLGIDDVVMKPTRGMPT